MKQQKMTFIGAGNMATSLISGLIKEGIDPQNITASDISEQQCQALQTNLGIQATTNNQEAIKSADLVILAVKPQILRTVAEQLKASLAIKKPLVISIAAGICSSDIQRWLGEDIPLVRTMPNTPAMIQAGATALFATSMVTEQQKNKAEALMRTTGLTIWLEKESEMDIVTALSGSGPAYYFLFMECFQKAAEDCGLAADKARLLTLQTALGAAKMAIECADDPAVLRRKVTSPKGTTESAIQSLLDNNIETILSDAIKSAQQRSIELSKELGADK